MQSVGQCGGKVLQAKGISKDFTGLAKELPDFSQLAETLPFVIPATELSKALGNIYTAKYFANLRWLGKGPRYYKLGHKIFYLRSDVIIWLQEEAQTFDPDANM